MGQYKFHTKTGAYLWGVIASRASKPGLVFPFDSTSGYTETSLSNILDFFKKAVEQACSDYYDRNKTDPATKALGLDGVKAIFDAEFRDILKDGKDAIISLDAYVQAVAKGKIAIVTEGCVGGLAKLFLGLVDPVDPTKPNGKRDAFADFAKKLGVQLLPILESFIVKQEAVATARPAYTTALWNLDRAWGISDPSASLGQTGLTLPDVEGKLGSISQLDALLTALSFPSPNDRVSAKVAITAALAELRIAFAALNSTCTTTVKGFDASNPDVLTKLAEKMASLKDVLTNASRMCTYDTARINFEDVVRRGIRMTFEPIGQMTVARIQASVAKGEKSLAPKFWPIEFRPGNSSGKTSALPWADPTKVTESPETRPPEWFPDPRTHSSGGSGEPIR